MDGVGKSTTCLLVAKKLGYEFIEKPLRFLTDEDGGLNHYLRIRDKVNESPDRIFTSWFYGLQYIYLNAAFGDKDIVTDRYLYSNYAWSGVPGNIEVYDLLAKVLKKPDITIILEAKKETIEKRLASRDLADSDFLRIEKAEEIYRKMKECGKKYGWKTWVIHTDASSAEEIAEHIVNNYRQVIQEMDEKGATWRETSRI